MEKVRELRRGDPVDSRSEGGEESDMVGLEADPDVVAHRQAPCGLPLPSRGGDGLAAQQCLALPMNGLRQFFLFLTFF